MYRQPRKSSAKTRPRRFFETGQGLVEYALIIAMVALLAIGATLYLGGQIKGTLSGVGTAAGDVLGANQGGPTPAPTPAPTPTPTPVNPDNIHNSAQCWTAGYYWYGNDCHSSRGSSSNYDHDSSGCVAAGYYWYHSDCHGSPPDANDFDHDSSGCVAAGFYWYGNDCHSSPAPTPTPAPTAPPKPTPPPAPTMTGHTLGAVCDSHPGPDETWHWDTPVWHDYTFDSTPPPGHWENGHWSGGWDCRF
jgi:Flp pilus assembly pilin Flp